MITINDLFEQWDITRDEVCKALNIPYRTLQNWLRGYRKCPDYVILLLDEWMSHHCLPNIYDRNYFGKAMNDTLKRAEYYKHILEDMSENE